MKLTRTIALFLATAALAAAAQLDVFAAASLSDALKEVAPKFQANTGNTLRFNFGASGALVRQIKEGAPADVIISADEIRVDQLESAGLLLAGSRATLLRNVMVVVVPAGAALRQLPDLAKSDVVKVAIGDPATVPAGTYAKEYLGKVKLWKPLLDKLVPLDNVRAVLLAVETGNADAGFVYRTDALISKKVKIALELSGTDAPRIVYPVAILKETKAAEAAKAFTAFLTDTEAQAVFAKYGFLPPGVTR